MKVLALDLSLTATGVAWHGGLTTLRSNLAGTPRLADLESKVVEIVTNWTVDVAVMEDIVERSPTSARTAMLHGVIRVLLHSYEIPTAVIPPASLKKYATGKGNATKPDMRMALYKRHDLDLNDDNQVDALWLYHMALDAYGEPDVEMPADHRAAIDKIIWPALLPLSGGPTGADITISVLENGEGG